MGEYILGGQTGSKWLGAVPPYFYSNYSGSNSSKSSGHVFCLVITIFFLVCSSINPFTVFQIRAKVVETLTRKILAEVHLY